MAGLGFEAVGHLRQHLLEGPHGDLALVIVEDLHEPRHVGALEIVRQEDVHAEGRDSVLFALVAVSHADRVAYILDAHLVDGDAPGVGAALHVGDFLDLRGCYLHAVRRPRLAGLGDDLDASRATGARSRAKGTESLRILPLKPAAVS